MTSRPSGSSVLSTLARVIVSLALCLSAPVGCQVLTPCHESLELWCLHSEQAGGPDIPEGVPRSDIECTPAEYRPDSVADCGKFETSGFSGGFTGEQHFFLDGEHVGTRFWTDDGGSYCGGFEFWYGQRVECPSEANP